MFKNFFSSGDFKFNLGSVKGEPEVIDFANEGHIVITGDLNTNSIVSSILYELFVSNTSSQVKSILINSVIDPTFNIFTQLPHMLLHSGCDELDFISKLDDLIELLNYRETLMTNEGFYTWDHLYKKFKNNEKVFKRLFRLILVINEDNILENYTKDNELDLIKEKLGVLLDKGPLLGVNVILMNKSINKSLSKDLLRLHDTLTISFSPYNLDILFEDYNLMSIDNTTSYYGVEKALPLKHKQTEYKTIKKLLDKYN